MARDISGVSDVAFDLSARRLRALIDSANEHAIIRLDRDGRIDFWSKGAEALFGRPEHEALGQSFSMLFLAEDRAARLPQNELTSALAEGRFEEVIRLERRDGSCFWANCVLQPITDGSGGFVKIVRDWTEEHRVDEALRTSEERLHVAQELSGVGIFDLDIQSGKAYVSDSYRAIWGFPPGSEVTPDMVFARIHPDDVGMVRTAFDTAIHDQQRFKVEKRIIRQNDGAIRWVRSQGGIVQNAAGGAARMVGVDIDVTEQKHAFEREQLLAQEVDHRAKNLLAVIQSVVQMTDAPTVKAFATALKGRIQALARVHGLLASNRWEGADLMTLVREELAPHIASGLRVQVNGPPVKLKPAAAQAIGVVLHELTINAVAHGALSVPQGRVEVRWKQSYDQQLSFRWEESGGPPVVPPSHTGFGMTAIQGTIRHQLGGTANIDWRAEGIVLDLTVPGQHLATIELPVEGKAAPVESVTPQVLVVEDEALIAMLVARMLEDGGFSVIGPAADIKEALELVHTHSPDAALLDIELGGERIYPVADALEEQGVPYAFLTGFGKGVLPERFRDVPTLDKPADASTITRLMQKMYQQSRA